MSRMSNLQRVALAAGCTLLSASVAMAWQPKRSAPVGGNDGPGELGAPRAVLYDQTSDAISESVASQDFTDAGGTYDAFDCEAADDFTVPAGQVWLIDTVFVNGAYFNGPGPVDWVTVRFYRDSSGTPGAQISGHSVVPPDVATGDFTLALPGGGVSLSAGTYWVSVQASMDGDPNGQWGWTERDTGSPAGMLGIWQNPDDGFGSGCTTWGTFAACGAGTGEELLFRLEGEIGEADVSVTKADAGSGPYAPGDSVTYQIDVANAGPYDASNVTVSDTIDVNLTYSSDTCGVGSAPGGVWTWDVGTVADAGSASCQLTVQVGAGASGTVDNTATVSADQPDPDGADNSSTASITVNNPNTSIDLTVTKVLQTAEPVDPGDQAVFQIDVVNNDGSNNATGVEVLDNLDPSLAYVSDTCSGSFADPTWTWSVGTLNAGASDSCQLTVALAGDAGGTIDNTAQVTADNPDPSTGDNSSTDSIDVATADLSLTKTTSYATVLEAGDTTTFTIEVANGGPDDATGVTVDDTIAAGLQYVSDTCSGTVAGGTWSWAVPTVSASGSQSCTVTVEADGTVLGLIENESAITAYDQYDPDTDDHASNVVEVGVVEHTGADPTGTMYTYATSEATGGPAFDWVDISGTGTALALGDDGEAAISPGFTVPFWAGFYSQLLVANNGAVVPGSSGDVTNPNQALPALGLPMIAPYWDDLDATGGAVYHETFDACPNTTGGDGACVVVQWSDRPHYSAIGAATFEVIVYDTGDVLTQYADTGFGSEPLDHGRSATVGLQGASSAVQYAFDTPAAVPDGFAVHFEYQREAMGQPGIPAVGALGALVLLLAIAAGGAVILRRW